MWATFWNQLEYCNMRSDWRVNRGGGYGLEVPCQYLFKGNSLAVKWHSKKLSRVERFENDAFWKRCFLVWTERKDAIWKWWRHRHDRAPDHSTMSIQSGGQTLPCGFSLDQRCSVNGRRRHENGKCGHKSFWKRNKTAPFSNGLVWTGPDWTHCERNIVEPGRFGKESRKKNRQQVEAAKE